MPAQRSHMPHGQRNSLCSSAACRGVAIINTVILIPLFLVIAVVVFDLARLYLNAIFAQEMVLLVAKLAASKDPDGHALADNAMIQLSRAKTGEDAAITQMRQAFWAAEVDPNSSRYHGKTYFSSKEKKVLNLAYGFAHKLNPRIYFPIPEPMSEEIAPGLNFAVNCSIYFRYTADSLPPDPLPNSADESYNSVMNENRDRIYHVDCVVPIIGMSLIGFNIGPPYQVVSRTAYAYRSGNIRP